MARVEELFEAIGKGNRKAVEELVRREVVAGHDVAALLNDTMIPAMRHMGDRFSRNEIYVPEMLIAARAMQAGLAIIEPILARTGHQPRGKVCIGTVKGDLHDIGKNLVCMMLKGAGYHVMDLGVNCDIAKFEQAVAQGAQAVLLSALLTTTMPYMKQVTAAFASRPDVRVIVGGAPVTAEYAKEIGAHGYGSDANEAVKVTDAALGLTA